MFKFNKWKLLVIGLLGLYFLSHVYNLTILPVFADEAIYIRWSQLIIDEPIRYAFFPLNDGKTPLLMWLTVPFQLAFSDQLFAARLVSVLAGGVQILALMALIKELGGKKIAQISGAVLTTILPFWFFHHRLALIEGLLALWITLSFWAGVKIFRLIPAKSKKINFSSITQNWFWTSICGLFLGLALWTKLPAILIFPALPFIVFIKPKSNTFRFQFLFKLGLAYVIAIFVFLLLKLHPAFGQLFSRGSDFLYPTSEVLLMGKWQQTLINIPNYIWYFMAYLTFPVLLLNIYGLFSPINKRRHILMIVSALAFIGPITLLGKVVYPRYFFPAIIFLTTSAALAIEEITIIIHRQKALWKQSFLALIFALLVANIVTPAVNFDLLAATNPDSLNLVSADKQQFLTEWSSGHGILEATQLIQSLAQDKTVAVATEGFFGTLPDGVLMYLHTQDVSNLMVEGIGQPITELPGQFFEKSRDYSTVLLLANSHRIKIDLSQANLLEEYCRPYHGPCLQLWDITSLR